MDENAEKKIPKTDKPSTTAEFIDYWREYNNRKKMSRIDIAREAGTANEFL